MMPNNTHPSLPLRLQLGSNLNAAAQAHARFCKIQVEDDESDTGDTARAPAAKDVTIGYHDYSSVKAPEASEAAVFSPQSVSGKEPTFPVKLHMILANPEFQDIIAWLPHGRSWRIIQQKAFEERVLPLYFRHGRYSSFARQVNGWGFRRVTHGSDYNSYYHEMFLIRMPHLCEKMKRLTSKDALSRKKNDDGLAPNFYELSRKNPLPAEENSLVPTESSKPTQNLADLLKMESFIADRRRAIGLASLFLDSGAGAVGGGGFPMHQGNRLPVGVGWHNGFNNLQNYQNANAGLLYGNLMPSSISAMSDHIRRLQVLNSGANAQELAKLMSSARSNSAFSEGANFNFP